jgi:hypothetical protein
MYSLFFSSKVHSPPGQPGGEIKTERCRENRHHASGESLPGPECNMDRVNETADTAPPGSGGGRNGKPLGEDAD